MKHIFIFLAIVGFSSVAHQFSLAASNPAPSEMRGEIGFFYTTLSPHGEWIELESGHRFWRPLHAAKHWRPYLLGRWVWTEYGWYWMSREPFGWITYHYGRWYCDDFYGWVWMPDDEWGPAWVEWRYDDDYIGWAPLPPYAIFTVGVGLHFSTGWTAPVHYWNFVRYRHFGSVIRYRDCAPEEYTRRLIHTTRTGGTCRVERDRIINQGVDRSLIERRGTIRIRDAEVRNVQEGTGERLLRPNGSQRTERIEVFRPSRTELQRGSDQFGGRRGERKLSLDMDKIERPRSADSGLRQEPRSQQNEPQEHPRQVQEEKREEQPRAVTPRVQEQKPQRDRKEMRRELIQRHEQRQLSSPPLQRERRMERQRNESPQQSPKENRSERRSESRR